MGLRKDQTWFNYSRGNFKVLGWIYKGSKQGEWEGSVSEIDIKFKKNLLTISKNIKKILNSLQAILNNKNV